MLTVKEFADIFHVTKKTVYSWINAGRVKVVRIDTTIRINQSEVDRIMRGASHEQSGH